MDVKICTKCGEKKPITAFYQHKRSKDGLTYWCKDCKYESQKRWRRKNSGHVFKYRKKWRQKNRGRILEYNKTDARQNSVLKSKFGISLDQYNRMYTKQKGCCAICGQQETHMNKGKITRLAVDHNHKTGRIRGLLCCVCNSKYGWYEKYKKQIDSYQKEDEE